MNLVWLRRDLRVSDNRALYYASLDSPEVHAVYVVTPRQWQQHDEAPAKLAFWRICVQKLESDLADIGIGLSVIVVPDYAAIPPALLQLAQKNHYTALYFNNEYEFNEASRDRLVCAAFTAAGIKVRQFDDRVLLPPGSILTGNGGYYTVFTPFRKAWKKSAVTADTTPLPPPAARKPLVVRQNVSSCPEWVDLASWRSDLWPAGEKAAQQMLQKFVAARAADYHLKRDFPGINGTSTISPYLTAGVLSPRQCLHALIGRKTSWPADGTGPDGWLTELIWRDFYNHVLVGFPRVSRGQPFKLQTRSLAWNYDQEKFEKWQQGQTGFPLVDAAMRQLRQTGWMHNRLRMVAAMFLSKYLFIDWRLGERFFMQNLLDGDLAANNGGWQWSASTGTDAVPYFRVFNPFSQSARFDSDGSFIRKFCPELAEVPAQALHDPQKLTVALQKAQVSFPALLVDPQVARKHVLSAFKALGAV